MQFYAVAILLLCDCLLQNQTKLEQDRVVQGGFCLSHSRPTGSQGVRGLAYRVPGSQGVSLQVPKGSRDRPTGSQGVKGLAYRVPGSQGVGPRGSRGWHTGPQGVNGLAYRVPGGQRIGLEGPRGSRGRPRGSQAVKGLA